MGLLLPPTPITSPHTCQGHGVSATLTTGAVEGACRHLTADRLDITGARWGLHGAEADLHLRAVTANSDLDAYVSSLPKTCERTGG